MRLYSVYDTKAEHFGNPVCARTDGEAKRMFAVIANDQSTEIGKHPEDFLLYRVGSFNNESGQLEVDPATCIAMAIELVEAK